VETGIIGSIDELPNFATKFGEMSREDQEGILGKISKYAKDGSK